LSQIHIKSGRPNLLPALSGELAWPTVLLSLLALFLLPRVLHAQPDLQLEQQFFNFNIGRSFQQEFNVNITNDGDRDLIWHSREEIIAVPGEGLPLRDDHGEVLGDFVWERAGRNCLKSGIALDRNTGYLVLSSFQNNYFGVVDPEDEYNLVCEWQGAGSLLAVTVLDGIVYTIASGQRYFQRYDIDGRDLGRLNTGDLAPATVTSSDDANLLFFMDFEHSNRINLMTPEGEVVGRIDGGDQFEDYPLGNIVWVDEHHTGHLWYISRSDQSVYQLVVEAVEGVQQNPEVAQHFDIPEVVNPHELDGIGHNGTDLVFGIYGRNDYLLVDDGLGEQQWVTWEPRSGTIEPESELDVFVFVNMSGMICGHYEILIHLYSNDPDHPDQAIDINLEVVGYPEIAIRWPESIGFPNWIDFNEYYGEVWVGYNSIVPVTIENLGTAPVNLNSSILESETFQVDTAALSVAPGDEMELNISLLAMEAGQYQGILRIRSNDDDEAEFATTLQGIAFDPPGIGIETNVIELHVYGDTASHVVDVWNDGNSFLRCEHELVPLFEPDIGDTGRTRAAAVSNFGGLAPGEHGQILLEFERDYGREIDDYELIILSNDPANDTVIISISLQWSLGAGIEPGELLLPSSPTLASIYPNPFNSTTRVRFGVPDGSLVALSLISLDGRTVRSYSPGFLAGGWHEWALDGADLTAGTYLLKLSGSGKTITSRVVLLK